MKSLIYGFFFSVYIINFFVFTVCEFSDCFDFKTKYYINFSISKFFFSWVKSITKSHASVPIYLNKELLFFFAKDILLKNLS
uniref:hypothetical protein n=1 Tax=Fibrocapsa japonica TaxID=94617 RepID=UPI002114614D|nr:hypothetical protein NQZ09_pgp107 [Fibrocapsa japonica]UTE95198.1 hypothetical protein FjapPt_p117 [Fibrocapsa japonica]